MLQFWKKIPKTGHSVVVSTFVHVLGTRQAAKIIYYENVFNVASPISKKVINCSTNKLLSTKQRATSMIANFNNKNTPNSVIISGKKMIKLRVAYLTKKKAWHLVVYYCNMQNNCWNIMICFHYIHRWYFCITLSFVKASSLRLFGAVCAFWSTPFWWTLTWAARVTLYVC